MSLPLETFAKVYNGNEKDMFNYLRENPQFEQDFINWLAEKNTAKSWTWLGKIKDMHCQFDQAVECYKKAIALDSEYYQAYNEWSLTDLESMPVEHINKMLSMPECSYRYAHCIHILNKRNLKVADLYNLGKNYTKTIIPELTVDSLWLSYNDTTPFFTTFMNQEDPDISKILDIFPADAEDADKKNLRVFFALCDEIRRLREKVAELSYQPGRREYEEAKKRFQENV